MLAGEQRAPRGTTSASWMGQKTGPGHWRPPGTGAGLMKGEEREKGRTRRTRVRAWRLRISVIRSIRKLLRVVAKFRLLA